MSTSNTRQILNLTKPTSMSEPDKMEEGRAKDMNLYQSPRKAETGLDSDRLPHELREFTLAEIKSSVVETGRSHEALESSGSSQFMPKC